MMTSRTPDGIPVMYSATCRQCSAPILTVLSSDPTVPLYACGYAGAGHVRFATRARADLINVRELTEHDWRDLADVIVAAPLRSPRVTTCDTPGCDAAGVDGRCLDHG